MNNYERYVEVREKLAKLPSGNISAEEIDVIVGKINEILNTKRRNKMNGAPATTATPAPLDHLSAVIELLHTQIKTLSESISLSHTKLYGDYNFPPTPGKEEPEVIETPGRINLLAGAIMGILADVKSIQTVAESIEQKS